VGENMGEKIRNLLFSRGNEWQKTAVNGSV
jgi:hypothetical protein